MKKKVLNILLKNYTKISRDKGIAKVIFDDKFEEIAEEIVKLFSLTDVGCSLPSKDAMICEGYNKAKNEDYKNRNSLRHKSQDDYYSGWMDCYDFIEER